MVIAKSLQEKKKKKSRSAQENPHTSHSKPTYIQENWASPLRATFTQSNNWRENSINKASPHQVKAQKYRHQGSVGKLVICSLDQNNVEIPPIQTGVHAQAEGSYPGSPLRMERTHRRRAGRRRRRGSHTGWSCDSQLRRFRGLECLWCQRELTSGKTSSEVTVINSKYPSQRKLKDCSE